MLVRRAVLAKTMMKEFASAKRGDPREGDGLDGLGLGHGGGIGRVGGEGWGRWMGMCMGTLSCGACTLLYSSSSSSSRAVYGAVVWVWYERYSREYSSKWSGVQWSVSRPLDSGVP